MKIHDYIAIVAAKIKLSELCPWKVEESLHCFWIGSQMSQSSMGWTEAFCHSAVQLNYTRSASKIFWKCVSPNRPWRFRTATISGTPEIEVLTNWKLHEWKDDSEISKFRTIHHLVQQKLTFSNSQTSDPVKATVSCKQIHFDLRPAMTCHRSQQLFLDAERQQAEWNLM